MGNDVWSVYQFLQEVKRAADKGEVFIFPDAVD